MIPPAALAGSKALSIADSAAASPITRPGADSGRALVEVAAAPSRLPALQAGETVMARISERMPDGKMTVVIKDEKFLLGFSKTPPEGNTLSLRVASGPPLSFVLLGAGNETAGQTLATRGNELARAVASGLADAKVTPLQTLSQPDKLPTLAAGEVVTARLAERLPDGSAVVLVKNSAFNLKAPPDALLSKEPMQLRVVSTMPQIQFGLLPASTAADDKSAAVSFTSAGKYLTALLDAGQSAKSAMVQETQSALLPDPSKPHAGEQLRHTVEKSGVFYEAHQRAWVDGRMSLDELKQEPQAKIAHEGHAKTASELGQMVQKQLDVHEQKTFVFQGQAWPGQPVEWAIQREEVQDRQAQGESDVPVWQTRLNLELPSLGGVAARLRMVGKQVQVVLDAQDEQTAALIEQHRARLGTAMDAAGLALASLLVKRESSGENSESQNEAG